MEVQWQLARKDWNLFHQFKTDVKTKGNPSFGKRISMLIFKDTSMTLETLWEFKMALREREEAWVQTFLGNFGRGTEQNLLYLPNFQQVTCKTTTIGQLMKIKAMRYQTNVCGWLVWCLLNTSACAKFSYVFPSFWLINTLNKKDQSWLVTSMLFSKKFLIVLI